MAKTKNKPNISNAMTTGHQVPTYLIDIVINKTRVES